MMSDGSHSRPGVFSPPIESWCPSLSFLRSGSNKFNNNGAEEPISWAFSRRRTSLFQELVECRIQGFGLSASGFGQHRSLFLAMTIAFAEGWERLWHERTKAGQIELSFSVSSTNGFAAGLNASTAGVTSRLELIERAAVQLIWTARSGTAEVAAQTLKDFFLRWQLKQTGWLAEIRKIELTDFGTVLIGFARHPTKGTVFDSIHGSSSREPQRKLLGSLLRMATTECEPVADLPFKSGPLGHASFYRSGAKNGAFDFLLRPPSGPLGLPNPSALSTMTLVESSNFPAVAVSQHPDWPKLTWGTQSIDGSNPWPHPIA